MASEDMRAPSPPLPLDPPASFAKEAQQPAVLDGQVQREAPSVQPSTERIQLDLKRVDSLRSPPPSINSPLLQQRQPIKDAVNYAANNVFEHSPVTNQLDPDYIKQLTAQVTAQVTEQVLQNLQSAGATPTPTSYAQRTTFPPPPPPPAPTARSPTEESEYEAARFTPPTPDRVRAGSRDERAYMSSSPEPPVSEVGSSFSHNSRDSAHSYSTNQTPRPFDGDAFHNARRSSYRRESDTGADREATRRKESLSEEHARDRPRRGSRESQTSYDGIPGSRARPVRVPSDVDETPLEKFWQPLFENGNPTTRLSQFLRGLALHIIEDYEPKSSIVITPAKMMQFLSETKIETELYPWDLIFGGKVQPMSISRIFQKLLCQHHFVQERPDTPPTIPGLTPAGFDGFMTCLIQAQPDSEYERIAAAVRDMPISNADNKSERFPKQLSRRLFPAAASIQSQQRLISSLTHEPYVLSMVKGTSAMPPPPPSAPPGPSFSERERQPYSSSQHSSTFDDDDLAAPPPVQIERERKPYGGTREGASRNYPTEDGQPPQNPQKPDPRNTRTNTGVPPASGYGGSGASDPMNIPSRSRSHRVSNSGAAPPSGNGNGGYSRSRRRSPPIPNPYARSDPTFADPSSSAQNPTSQRPSRNAQRGEPDEETLRNYRSRSRIDRNSLSSGGNGPDEDPRGYPIPSRGVPISNGYEYGSGPGQGPPLGSSVPVGSYPTRRPTMGGTNGADDRRRSMYNPNTAGYSGGDGGTDGYGSFANGNGNGSGMNGGYPPPPGQSYGSSGQH